MGQSAAKQHEKRISRCLQSFSQLQADIRHINLHASLEFARPQTELEAAVWGLSNSSSPKNSSNLPSPDPNSNIECEVSLADSVTEKKEEEQSPSAAAASSAENEMVLQFRPFTKLTKKSALPWLWKINDNVIVTATVTPRSVAESVIAAAAAASTASPSSTPVVIPPLNSNYTSYSLTLREFYHLYLYFVDHMKTVSTLREQLLKFEHPEEYEALQESKRNAIAAALRKSSTTPGNDAEDEEEKTVNKSPPLPTNRKASAKAVSECSICLASPEEEGSGEELVVLPCNHHFCQGCIDDWRTQSSSCPLCRREIDEADTGDDAWILTSPNVAELKKQFERVIAVPYEFVEDKGSFPPVDNTRGVKSAGDLFSLAAGEAIDIFAPRSRGQQQQQQRAVAAGEAGSPAEKTTIPVAQPVAKSASP